MSNTANDIFSGMEGLFQGMTTPVTEQEKVLTATPVVSNDGPISSFQSTSSATLVQSGQAKLQMIKREMNDSFMERDNVIDCMLYALVSGQSLLMLGDPGTARFDI